MGIERSPRKQSQSTSDDEVTLKALLAAINHNNALIKQMEAKTDAGLQRVEEKINLIYDRVKDLESKGKQIKPDIEMLKSSIGDCRNEIKEQADRSNTINNPLVMGIEESDVDDQLLSELLSIILPDVHTTIVNDRVRVIKPNQKHSRPIRLFLLNPKTKSTALQNCKRLKNNPRFQKISVTRDLTKLQQFEQKNSPRVTRSTNKTSIGRKFCRGKFVYKKIM